MQLVSTITCPACGHRASETMPTDACMFFYVCKGCGTRLKPRQGDCCVFCSYGTFLARPVPGEVWLFVIPFAAGMLVLEELRKWIVRRSFRGA